MFGQNDDKNHWNQQNASTPQDEPVQPADNVVVTPDAVLTDEESHHTSGAPTADPDPVVDGSPPVVSASGTVGSDDLLTIKKDALQELGPLVGHLDQSPEEKFRTTMMMIQASDDHSLVQTAYVAAKEISNEKARAQALLDVINEINYFTQPKTT